jgi:hypothetical protein
MFRKEIIPTPVKTWGVMLRVHREAQFLPKVFKSLKKLAQGREVKLCISADRPTPDVITEVSKQLRYCPSNFDVDLFEAPEPLVGTSENFMKCLQDHYARLLKMGPMQGASLWDDDMWLHPRAALELRKHLACLEYHRVEARTLFLWNSATQHNRKFPAHWSAILFRVLDGDQFPTRFMVHCPETAANSTSVQMMKWPLLNGGYIDDERRERAWKRAKRAGKMDGHSFALVRPPILENVSEYRKK